MSIEILMPALSPTMTEGKLGKWLVAEGDVVAAGDAVAEIETDKATMEVEAAEDGVVGALLVAEGTEDVPVNTPIAVLLEEGEDAAALPATKPPATAKAAPASQAAPTPPASPRLFASPLARRLAEQGGISLASISGSGPHGRIVKRDIEAALAAGPATVAAAAPAPLAAAGYEEAPLSLMRKTIARRLSESKQTIPHFYLTVDVELDALLALRKEMNAAAEEGRLSVNDFIIKAAALALKKTPDANVQFAGDVLYRFNQADISVAVAVGGGLVTPVIRAAETKSVTRISHEMAELAEKARAGQLAPEDYSGGTFSISNLGMFGIKNFLAVINPPQAGILAVGRGEPRAVVRDGELAVATVMSVTLSCDHRAVDGAVGAAFLAAFKGLIEKPYALVL
jgi:pyruvate dehydrogenase E2 component (dihydrolipoamide acetyltransferase)